jgi:hypothetical protein
VSDFAKLSRDELVRHVEIEREKNNRASLEIARLKEREAQLVRDASDLAVMAARYHAKLPDISQAVLAAVEKQEEKP